MYEPRKRTALDGKTWWCAFNVLTGKWSTLLCHGKYKTKRDCQYAIDKSRISQKGFIQECVEFVRENYFGNESKYDCS